MIVTYAQNLEDVLLNRVFRAKASGFYIDVGAHDPDDMSVTRHFYNLGWTGINIEPVPESYERLKEKRPRDINLNIALGDRFECRPLHVVSGRTPYLADCAALSSLDRETAEQAASVVRSPSTREIVVEVRTLGEICRAYCHQPIDFLKIDVEGWERQVLEGADFLSYRPIVLVLEAMKPNAPVLDPSSIECFSAWASWEDLVLKAGYLFAYFDGLNRFYVRQEDEHLRKLFDVPVGFYDDVQFTDPRRVAPSLRDRIVEQSPILKETQASLDEVYRERRQLEADYLRVKAELVSLSAESEWRGREMNRLKSTAEQLVETNAGLEQRIEKIAARELKVEAENLALREVVQAFEAWGENIKRQGERLLGAQRELRREKEALQNECSKLDAENRHLNAEASSLRSRLHLVHTVLREQQFQALNRKWLTIQRYLPIVTLLLRRRSRLSVPPAIPFETVRQASEQPRVRLGGQEGILAPELSLPEKPKPPTTGSPKVAKRPNHGWIMAPSGESLAEESPGYWRELLPVILKAGSSNSTIAFVDPFLEKTLASPLPASPLSGEWVGIAQWGPSIPRWITTVASQQQLTGAARLQSASWTARRSSCRALLALSDYQAEHLREASGVRVIVARPRVPLGRPEWSWDRFAADGKRRIIQPDERLQRVHGIHMLEVAEAVKTWWRSPLLAPDDLVRTELAELMRDHRLLSYMLETVTCENPPSGCDRADMLSGSVVFAHLYDAIAPGILFECIASATPILINPLPAVREYLGNSYPLYYFSYPDAAEKAVDDSLIRRTHDYLEALPQRQDLSEESFLSQLAML